MLLEMSSDLRFHRVAVQLVQFLRAGKLGRDQHLGLALDTIEPVIALQSRSEFSETILSIKFNLDHGEFAVFWADARSGASHHAQPVLKDREDQRVAGLVRVFGLVDLALAELRLDQVFFLPAVPPDQRLGQHCS